MVKHNNHRFLTKGGEPRPTNPMKHIILIILLSLSTVAAPVQFDDPTWVKLSDGRIVPFGAGLICTNTCTEEEIAGDHTFSSRWLIALPIAGAVIIGLLAKSSESTQISIVPSSNIITTTNTTIPTPVPEPTTYLLLGAGLLRLLKRRPTA